MKMKVVTMMMNQEPQWPYRLRPKQQSHSQNQQLQLQRLKRKACSVLLTAMMTTMMMMVETISCSEDLDKLRPKLQPLKRLLPKLSLNQPLLPKNPNVCGSQAMKTTIEVFKFYHASQSSILI